MGNDFEVFSTPKLKDAIQDIKELFSQNNLAFLLGAGCSKVAGLPLMPDLTKEVLEHDKMSKETKSLLDEVCKLFSGTKTATIEDYMSEIVDLLSIAVRRTQRGASDSKIAVGTQKRDARELQQALIEIKHAIYSTIVSKEANVKTHQQFVRAIHYFLQAGKSKRSVDYFTLNYDTLIEDALGLELVNFTDGFRGSTTGWWEPVIFNMNDYEARVFKVHGSIDWCLLENDPLPRKIRRGIKTESNKDNVLIYPSATKYQETQRDPFAQILNFMRHSLCPNEGKEIVLAICGYSFGDSHIDSEIENALYQSKGQLTLAAFVNTDNLEGRLLHWHKDSVITDQIRVYTKKGFFHGDNKLELDADIPWWKFEVIAQLLGGQL